MRSLQTAATLSIALALSSSLAWAVDEPATGGTFNTPGYAPAQPAKPATTGGATGSTSGSATNPADERERNSTTPRDANSSRQQPQRAGQSGADARPDLAPRRVDLPAPLPSEFQKFVQAATGRLLPVFGGRFFSEAADRPSGLSNIPVSADYTVGPGDELVIRAWGSIDVDYRSTIDRNGQVSLPKVGSFNVAGVKASELEKHLRAQIARLYTNFTLNVTLGQLRGVTVFVVGPAQRPGVFTLPSQSTLLSAVVAAGGPALNGSMRKLTLRRDGRVVSEFDVYDFLVQGDKSKDVQLVAGDVLVFQPAGARVALTGSIDTPAIYELRSAQEPLRDVLRYAGGASVLANPNRVQLERIDSTQAQAARFVEEFKVDADGLQKQLRDGDVLTLLAISPRFANAVTLKGHVAQPLRYPFRPGMRISDLIPDREALISPDFYRRKNLLVQVLEEVDADHRTEQVSGMASGPERNATQRAQDRSTQDRSSQDRSSQERRAQQRGTLESRDDMAVMSTARKRSGILFDELNWDYAVIERLNSTDLATQVIPFNLGKVVLQGDPLQNIELMSGDVVTVFSQKDLRVPVARQTRLVSIEGEVASPGIYQLLPGETLKQLIVRIGGFTPQAYVYGLDFSREETRVRQRENLQQAMDRLESLSATQTARDAANRRDDISAERNAAVSDAATQAQLSRLSRLQPNGRIALELSADSSSVDQLPDVPLENGDRVAVPTRPGFVTVAGAVVNSNALLWKPGRTAGDYLRLAGVDETADISNMFILRADGTVSHTNDKRGFLGRGTLEGQAVQPGDAVVVPSQLDYETWGRALVRNLKDWSQIFSQFGLGAAAIQTLRR
jgi:polysaccharide biosynthesis/export protein